MPSRPSVRPAADDPDETAARRSIVPSRARRTPYLAAVWTGLGAAVVGLVTSIVVVAACWLPVSGPGGHTSSAIRAGLLTFLAALHGGLTVDSVHTAWVPLGTTLLLGTICWRAGSGLGDAVTDIGAESGEELGPREAAVVGVVQVATFAVVAMLTVPLARLGTSHASVPAVGAAAVVLFALFGGAAYVRSTVLRDEVRDRLAPWAAPVLRAAAATVAVYLAAGAVLTAASLVLHHDRVVELSRQVGGGLGGLPVALLGVLAAPNAAIAGAGYLAGPGFSVGAGTTASLFGATHGVVPAFPLLAALPTGARASLFVWAFAGLVPLLAGVVVARCACRTDTWAARFRTALGAAVTAGVVLAVLAWQGGGSVGAGRLATVGASPWRLGGAVLVTVAVSSVLCLGVAALWRLAFGAEDVWAIEAVDDVTDDVPDEIDQPAGSDLPGETDDEPYADPDDVHDTDVIVVRRSPRMIVDPYGLRGGEDGEDSGGSGPDGDTLAG